MPNDGSCLLLAAAVACEDAPASPHTSSLALVLVVAFELPEDLSLEILVRAGWTVLRVLRMARATSEDGVFVLGTYVRSFGRSSRGVSGFASLRRRKGVMRVGGFVSIGANDPSSPTAIPKNTIIEDSPPLPLCNSRPPRRSPRAHPR